jgi:hypothetical protein
MINSIPYNYTIILSDAFCEYVPNEDILLLYDNSWTYTNDFLHFHNLELPIEGFYQYPTIVYANQFICFGNNGQIALAEDSSTYCDWLHI